MGWTVNFVVCLIVVGIILIDVQVVVVVNDDGTVFMEAVYSTCFDVEIIRDIYKGNRNADANPYQTQSKQYSREKF